MKKILVVFAIVLFSSGIRAQIDESIYHSRIYHTCKVWGYVKYFHTGVASGMVDWDSVLVSSVEDIKNAADNEEFNRVLLEMISQAGEMQSSSEELPEVPDSLNNTPDHNWIEADLFTEDVKAKLLDIKDKFRPQTNVYVPNPDNDMPDFSQDDAYYLTINLSDGERVLAICRYWNIINYFFPYKSIMDRNWDEILEEFLPKIIGSENDLEFTLAFKEFTAQINDSHSFFTSPDYRVWLGGYFPPFLTRFIENEMVITKVLDGVEEVFPGDVIKRIDGYDIYELRDSLRKYAHGSNDVIIERELNEIISWGKIGRFEITVERGTELITENLKRNSGNYTNLNNSNLPAWKDTVVNGCNFGIVDMGSLQIEDLDNMFNDLWESDYIIFDVRNYPNSVLWDMTNYLFREPINIANFTVPLTTYPGTFTWEYETIGGYNSNVYQNNIILLFDERTQSHAEYTCMGLEQFPGAIKIGSTTSAADGNVRYIYLPGIITTVATFLGTYYPDFTPTQRVGIIPDFEVHPTIQGIREGRDEVLEFALNRCSLNDIDMYEQDLKQVKLYPNPATDNLNFEFDESLTGIIEIYDISGRKCKSMSYASNSGSIDISDLNQGAYIINIISGGKNIRTEKFMKK